MVPGNEWVELAERPGDELVVTLLWRPADDATGVRTIDVRRGESAFALVPGDCALDAFHHPACYLHESRAGRPDAAAVDVDELWLSELAAATLADLAELLARQPGSES